MQKIITRDKERKELETLRKAIDTEVTINVVNARRIINDPEGALALQVRPFQDEVWRTLISAGHFFDLDRGTRLRLIALYGEQRRLQLLADRQAQKRQKEYVDTQIKEGLERIKELSADIFEDFRELEAPKKAQSLKEENISQDQQV